MDNADGMCVCVCVCGNEMKDGAVERRTLLRQGVGQYVVERTVKHAEVSLDTKLVCILFEISLDISQVLRLPLICSDMWQNIHSVPEKAHPLPYDVLLMTHQ